MMPSTYTIAGIDGTSPGAINSSIWRQGFTNGSSEANEVNLVCATCGSVITNFTVYSSVYGARSKLPTAVNTRNQLASRTIRQHFRMHEQSEDHNTVLSAASTKQTLTRKRTADQAQLALLDAIDITGSGQATDTKKMTTFGAQNYVQSRSCKPRIASINLPGQLVGPIKTPHHLAAGCHDISYPIASLHLVGTPVHLPCMMKLEFQHSLYGPHKVWAVLHWVDLCSPQPQKAATVDRGERFQVAGQTSKQQFERRCLYLHQIVHVWPLGSPLSLYVGQVFSSLQASARRIGHAASDGEQAWHLVFQAELSLNQVIMKCGFANPSVANAIRAMEQDETIPHSQTAERLTQQVRLGRLLSERMGYDDEPLLSMTMQRDKTMSVISEDEQPDNYDSTAEGRVPAWVPIHLRSRFRRIAAAGSLQDVSFRDCLASLCQLECNDLECDVPEDVETTFLAQMRTPEYVCGHGIGHAQYKGHNTVRFHPNEELMDSKRTTKKCVDQQVEAWFLQPKKRRSSEPRSAWCCRISFDGLQMSHRLKETRYFASGILRLVTAVLVRTQSGALGQILSALHQAKMIRTIEDLDDFDRFHGVWVPCKKSIIFRGKKEPSKHGLIEITWQMRRCQENLPFMAALPAHLQPFDRNCSITYEMFQELAARHPDIVKCIRTLE